MPIAKDATGVEKIRAKILLVDDNPGDRRLVIELLKLVEDGDYVVVEATTLAEAEATLPGCGADVVMLDLSLPDGTGVFNVETIRALDADVPVLVLSGSEDERMTAAVVEAGASTFMSKMDLSEDTLSEVLRRILAGASRL